MYFLLVEMPILDINNLIVTSDNVNFDIKN